MAKVGRPRRTEQVKIVSVQLNEPMYQWLKSISVTGSISLTLRNIIQKEMERQK